MSQVPPLETPPTTPMRAKAPAPGVKRTSKSLAAYRTITEVAAELGVATHVLRFWETKFPVIKPLKKSGGRRYYQADDIALLRLIQSKLYDEGMTIRGVQTYLQQTNKKDLAAASQTNTLSTASLQQELNNLRNLLLEGLND